MTATSENEDGAVIDPYRGGGFSVGQVTLDATPTSVCTGLTATWCPVHGDCDCPRDPIHGEINFDVGEFSCPLHAWNSPHAEEADDA
jgi:hypothetical protein